MKRNAIKISSCDARLLDRKTLFLFLLNKSESRITYKLKYVMRPPMKPETPCDARSDVALTKNNTILLVHVIIRNEKKKKKKSTTFIYNKTVPRSLYYQLKLTP